MKKPALQFSTLLWTGAIVLILASTAIVAYQLVELIKENSAETGSRLQFLETLSEQRAYFEGLEMQFTEIQESVMAIEERLVQPDSILAFIQELEAIADEHGVALMLIANSPGQITIDGRTFLEYSFEAQAIGGFQEIATFIAAAERADTIVFIDRIKLDPTDVSFGSGAAPPDERASEITADLRLRVFELLQ